MECAVDVGNSIACKSACEDEVLDQNKIIQQSKNAYSIAGKIYSQTSVWLGLVGLGFIISSFFLTHTAGFLIFMSLLFFVGAIFMYSASRRYRH